MYTLVKYFSKTFEFVHMRGEINSYWFGISNRRENKFCSNEVSFRLHFKTIRYFDGHVQAFHFGQFLHDTLSPEMKFHLCQNDRYETHTVLSFISLQFMGTQVKRFSTEMKSHTGLGSFCLSCERTLRNEILFNFSLHVGSQRNTLEVQRLPGDILQDPKFAKSTGKNMCSSIFIKQTWRLQACNFIRKRMQHGCSPANLSEEFL